MEKKERMKNLELLRCIAMMMVVVLHFLGKGELLEELSGESLSGAGITAWVLECFALVAVNVYMLISGYLLCQSRFKWSRLVSLLLQVWFYSILVGLAGGLLGTAAEPFSIYYLLQIVFPVTMKQYWYVTAYVLLYLLLPMLGPSISSMTKKQHQVCIFTFLTLFCFMKSLLPVRLALDSQGYDVLWYITLFLVAAYFRKYECTLFQKKGTYLLAYFVCVGLIFACLMGYRMIYLSTGKLQTTISVATDYNHLFAFAASLCFFLYFTKISVQGVVAKAAGFAGPLTLGVYLLHESVGIRYAWPKYFGAGLATTPLRVVGFTLLAAVGVFMIGIVVEFLRVKLFALLDKVLSLIPVYRKGKEWIK